MDDEFTFRKGDVFHITIPREDPSDVSDSFRMDYLVEEAKMNTDGELVITASVIKKTLD